MTQVLSNEQINQVVQNTMVVLLARPDLLPDWNANLMRLMEQTREARLEDEMFFVGAVLTLLHKPEDSLPTGTIYDHAWRALLAALQTGVVQDVGDDTETVTVDRLLKSVSEAVVKVLTEAPDHGGRLAEEIREMRGAAVEAEIPELIAWLDDAILVLGGEPVTNLGAQHAGIFKEFWDFIVQRIP